MKKIKLFTVGLCALTVVSCGNATGNGALIGTGAGAALGAIIGKIAGNTAVGAAVGGAVGAGTGAIIGRHMDKVKAQAQAVQNAKVESVTDANGLQAVKVSFDSGILFATGKSDLTATSKSSLAQFANVLKANTDCDIAIQGYTDNQGFRGKTAAQSQELNVQLSQNRANSVSAYLQSLGVSPSQIKSVQGFGEANPVASNATAAGQKENRRVEVYMYASQAMVEAANNGTLQ
ncbi:MAG: OmpA family protein [Prevotella sp.]|nr:OmpA family protein [Prevotella sp.]